jgi:hypothetical protein
MRFPFSAGVRLGAPEHGGTGTWQIVEGTGRYTTLRGLGTYVGTKLSGDSNVFESITYRTSWCQAAPNSAPVSGVEKCTTGPALRGVPRRLGGVA